MRKSIKLYSIHNPIAFIGPDYNSDNGNISQTSTLAHPLVFLTYNE